MGFVLFLGGQGISISDSLINPFCPGTVKIYMSYNKFSRTTLKRKKNKRENINQIKSEKQVLEWWVTSVRMVGVELWQLGKIKCVKVY